MSASGHQGLCLPGEIPWVQACQSFSSAVHEGGQRSLGSTSQVYPEMAVPPAPRHPLKIQFDNHVPFSRVRAPGRSGRPLSGMAAGPVQEGATWGGSQHSVSPSCYKHFTIIEINNICAKF